MIIETIRCLTAGLNSSTYGVNVQLASVAIDGGDTRPASITTIVDETTDAQVARGRLPDTTPAIAVMLAQQVTLDGEVMSSVRDGKIPLVIRYAMGKSDTNVGNANIYYVMRAIQECLRQFHANKNVADRTRNNIFVGECIDMTVMTTFHPEEDNILAGAMLVTYQVRDNNP